MIGDCLLVRISDGSGIAVDVTGDKVGMIDASSDMTNDDWWLSTGTADGSGLTVDVTSDKAGMTDVSDDVMVDAKTKKSHTYITTRLGGKFTDHDIEKV